MLTSFTQFTTADTCRFILIETLFSLLSMLKVFNLSLDLES